MAAQGEKRGRDTPSNPRRLTIDPCNKVLTIINEGVVRIMSGTTHRRSVIPIFVIVMCIAVLLMTALHTIEASAWAGAYRLLGALPDHKTAILYLLGAMTTFGHATLFLDNSGR